MIVSKITGGLGNQLFKYLAARNLADQTNRQLILDTSWYSKTNFKNGVTSQRIFELDKFSALARRGPQTELHKSLIIGLTKFPSPWMKTYSTQIGESNYFEKDVNSKILLLKGNYEGLKYLPRDAQVLHFLESCGMTTSWFYEKQQELSLLNPIVVHLRLTDYLKFPNVYFVPTLTYYLEGLKLIREKTGQNEVWVFSDDEYLATQFFQNTGFKLKVVQTPNNVGSLEIMSLMSHATSIVMANSTFSWWAANLSWMRNSSTNVVMPSKFTHLPNDTASLMNRKEWQILDPSLSS